MVLGGDRCNSLLHDRHIGIPGYPFRNGNVRETSTDVYLFMVVLASICPKGLVALSPALQELDELIVASIACCNPTLLVQCSESTVRR